MALAVNLQGSAFGVVNHASGQIVADAAAAAAVTVALGFAPRAIRFHNLTDRISDEWFEGMDTNAIYVALVGILAKLDADAGVTDTNYAALWTPSAVVAGVGGPTSVPPYDVAPAAASDVERMRQAIVGLLAKLDADAGVTDTNYAALWTPAVATAAALRASITGVLAKLDADTGVTDTNYAALWTPASAISLHTVANGTRTLETTNGIAVSGNTFTLTAATMVASKQFYWEALG